jgi:site-specific recombinase XerD
MATCLFRSPLAYRLQCFWETRQHAGRVNLNSQRILRYLDQYLLVELKPGETITREVAERWIKGMEKLGVGTRINRISVLRQFCRYLAHFDPRTCLLSPSFLPRRTRPAPHIYTRKEVRQIMAAARRIGPRGSLRPTVIATLVGLLYTTGLRIGEALRLTLADVDLKKRVLLIRETKFKKTRYVPLSASGAGALQVYLRRRRRAGMSTSPDAPFFVNLWGHHYGHVGFTTVFLEIIRQLGIRGPRGQRGPRIHDFRHSFAVNRLLAWYREGSNLAAKLPLLSTYLGHATVTGTEIYLHATAELLESAGRRFHARCAVPSTTRKKPMFTTDIASPIRGFFEQHLVSQRGLSGHTVLAYRDALKLLLAFVSQRRRKACVAVTLEDLTADTVRSFLDYLERGRKNSVPTRNARLAAIHAFFNYLTSLDPRHLAQAQTILAIPFKRQTHRVGEYLERDEVQKLFAGIDGRTLHGQRDDALLRLLYNTGMRVQELVDLDANHLRFTRPYLVRIMGKGRKERTCPLWRETVAALKAYLEKRGVRLNDATPLFVNRDGSRLTRFGVRYIISRRVSDAAQSCPSLLTRRVSPHTFRRTTAMHLLQSNVDLSMIRSWLGHASIETTNAYVEIDLEMKRKTLESAEKLIPKNAKRRGSWHADDRLIAWLAGL